NSLFFRIVGGATQRVITQDDFIEWRSHGVFFLYVNKLHHYN
ncbi:MAG: hypothetical protein ACI90V_010190, partial [Bacillariaceae sp.]